MTIFVIDAPVAIDLATSGAAIPSEHSLAAPTLLRSQVLALVYGSVRHGEIDENGPVERFSTTSGGYVSGSSATDLCRTMHGG